MCWIDLKQVLLTTTATTGLFCFNTVISIFFAFQFGLCHIGTVWNIGRHIYFMCTKLVYVRILFVVISSLYDALKERRSTIKKVPSKITNAIALWIPKLFYNPIQSFMIAVVVIIAWKTNLQSEHVPKRLHKNNHFKIL